MLSQTAPLLRGQGGGFSEGLVLAAISLCHPFGWSLKNLLEGHWCSVVGVWSLRQVLGQTREERLFGLVVSIILSHG